MPLPLMHVCVSCNLSQLGSTTLLPVGVTGEQRLHASTRQDRHEEAIGTAQLSRFERALQPLLASLKQMGVIGNGLPDEILIAAMPERVLLPVPPQTPSDLANEVGRAFSVWAAGSPHPLA